MKTYKLLFLAERLGCARETLRRRIKIAGLPPQSAYSVDDLLDILRPWLAESPLEKARAKKLAQESAMLKLDLAEREGTLVNMAEAEKQILEWFTLPVMQALNSAPTTLDTQCNPTDPELARAAILRWVEETKRLIRVKLPTK